MTYQLPTDTNVYVVVLDDDDTQVMFDEWHEYSNAPTHKPNDKLRLFVDWPRTSMESAGHKQVSLSPHGSVESALGGRDSSAERAAGDARVAH